MSDTTSYSPVHSMSHQSPAETAHAAGVHSRFILRVSYKSSRNKTRPRRWRHPSEHVPKKSVPNRVPDSGHSYDSFAFCSVRLERLGRARRPGIPRQEPGNEIRIGQVQSLAAALAISYPKTPKLLVRAVNFLLESIMRSS